MTTVRFERKGAVGSIVLANPPFNRIDLKFTAGLRQAANEASDSDIRVLVVRAEGPNFSGGGEVREWTGKDVNWFRTFVTDVNTSYRLIEGLRVPRLPWFRASHSAAVLSWRWPAIFSPSRNPPSCAASK